jgi:hypothetical protein
MPATIDYALDILKDTGPEFGGGLSNHGPMAAEALFSLGRADAVIPWVKRYRRHLQEYPHNPKLSYLAVAWDATARLWRA